MPGFAPQRRGGAVTGAVGDGHDERAVLGFVKPVKVAGDDGFRAVEDEVVRQRAVEPFAHRQHRLLNPLGVADAVHDFAVFLLDFIVAGGEFGVLFGQPLGVA